jgi:hypothetical protein
MKERMRNAPRTSRQTLSPHPDPPSASSPTLMPPVSAAKALLPCLCSLAHRQRPSGDSRPNPPSPAFKLFASAAPRLAPQLRER